MDWRAFIKPIKAVYNFLPVPVRLGGHFRHTYRFLKMSQWWELAKLREYQMTRLQKLVQHAYQNVPYYRKLFNEHGIHPAQIQNFDDFRRIPTISKETVRQQIEALTATNIPLKKRIRLTTGGSTGTPMLFFRTRTAYPLTLAFEWRNFNWNGYKFGDKVAVLRGNLVEPRLFEFDRSRNALVFASYKMTTANLPRFVDALNRFQPKFLLAYPSTVELLAQFLQQQTQRPPFLRALQGVFTSSETLFEWQKNFIESTLEVPVFDKYGNSEMVTMIGECEAGNYHDFMEYSYTEILDPAGNRVEDENQSGEIVGTSFVNSAMPLLRYCTGDLVRTTAKKCACGRALTRMLAIEGRTKEVIITRDGSKLPLAPILFGIHDLHWDQVRRIQFVQEQPGELQILAETEHHDPGAVSQYITRIIEQRLLGQFFFRVEMVDKIPLTPRKKFQYLIQRVAGA